MTGVWVALPTLVGEISEGKTVRQAIQKRLGG